MKRIALVTALLGAVVFAFAGIAMAASGGPTYGNSGIGGASGKGTAVNHYTVAYTDPILGPVSCTGVNQVKTKQPTQDSFTCTSTSGLPLTNQSPGQALTLLGYPWASDYSGMQAAQTYNITGTVSVDGMSYSAVAVY